MEAKRYAILFLMLSQDRELKHTRLNGKYLALSCPDKIHLYILCVSMNDSIALICKIQQQQNILSDMYNALRAFLCFNFKKLLLVHDM